MGLCFNSVQTFEQNHLSNSVLIGCYAVHIPLQLSGPNSVTLTVGVTHFSETSKRTAQYKDSEDHPTSNVLRESVKTHISFFVSSHLLR